MGNMQPTTESQTLQNQIDVLDKKMDIMLEHIQEQRNRSRMWEDLGEDLYIIGKDAFRSTVEELDRHSVSVDADEIRFLMIRFLRNLKNISELFETLESLMDLKRDLMPIVNDIGLQTIHKVDELHRKGYIDFLKETGKIFDNIVTNFSTDDVKMLSDNIVTILQTVKNLTQPDMLRAMNNAVMVYKNMDPENIEEYSLWKAFREMNSPEMRRGLGFMIQFMKNLSADNGAK